MIYRETTLLEPNKEKQHLPGFDDRYHNIVDYILKITKEIWEDRAIWVIYDTYKEDLVVHSGGHDVVGVDAVIKGTLKTLASFPDRKMDGEAVIWSKDNEDIFYSSHRIFSTATNLGSTRFGEATGKKVNFRTIADCVVQHNKIVEEWLVRDNIHLIEQLGFVTKEMAIKDTHYKTKGPVLTTGGHLSEANVDADEPERIVVELINRMFVTGETSEVADFYAEDATVHGIRDIRYQGISEIKGHFDEFFSLLSDIRVFLERVTSNQLRCGHELAARWRILGKYKNGVNVVMPGISHYVIKDGKITEEWIVYDLFDVMCQAHA